MICKYIIMPSGSGSAEIYTDILGNNTHDEINMDATTSEYAPMPWLDKVPTDEIFNVEIQNINDLNTILKKQTKLLKQKESEAKQIQHDIADLAKEYNKNARAQKRLQDAKTMRTAEFYEIYERELQQQIESIKQKIDKFQNTGELAFSAIRTILTNIKPCNDLLSYLEYISDALEQLSAIKILYERQQLQEEQEQLKDSMVTSINRTLEKSKNSIDVSEALNALNLLLSALEKLLTIPEAQNFRLVLESGKLVQTGLAQISTLGISVEKILTQAMPPTHISVIEVLETQIAALKHGELYLPLNDFIESLKIIANNKAEFTKLDSEIQKQELILKDLTKRLIDFQKHPPIPEELSGKSLKLAKTLNKISELQKKVNLSVLKASYDLDFKQNKLAEHHSTITSLNLEIGKLKQQAFIKLGTLEYYSANCPLLVTPLKQDAKIDLPEIDLYTEEQFAKYDERINKLPDAGELIQKLHDSPIERDVYTQEQFKKILVFYDVAKNCAAIRHLLEDSNIYEIKIKAARLNIAKLEKEITAKLNAVKLATEQATRLKEATLNELERLDEKARLDEEETIQETVRKIAESPDNREILKQKLKETLDRANIEIKTLKTVKLNAEKEAIREVVKLNEEVKQLEADKLETQKEKKNLEKQRDEIDNKILDLLDKNEKSTIWKFIALRLKYDLDSNKLDKNYDIHSQVLSQLVLLAMSLLTEIEKLAKLKREEEQQVAHAPVQYAVIQQVAQVIIPQIVPPLPIIQQATAVPLPASTPTAPIVDDWIMLEAEVLIEEDVIIAPKTTIEVSAVTRHDITALTQNGQKLKVEILPPIIETHTPKIKNLSIIHEFATFFSRKTKNTEENNLNADEISAELLSRFNSPIRDKTPNLTKLDNAAVVTPYYNTLMLLREERICRETDEHEMKTAIYPFGYDNNGAQVCSSLLGGVCHKLCGNCKKYRRCCIVN